MNTPEKSFGVDIKQQATATSDDVISLLAEAKAAYRNGETDKVEDLLNQVEQRMRSLSHIINAFNL